MILEHLSNMGKWMEECYGDLIDNRMVQVHMFPIAIFSPSNLSNALELPNYHSQMLILGFYLLLFVRDFYDVFGLPSGLAGYTKNLRHRNS